MSEDLLAESGWRSYYRVGGIAALAAVLVFRRYFGVEMLTFNGFGLFNVPETAPVTAGEWFTLLQNEPFVGLVLFNLVDMVNYVLVGLIFLALYGALKRTHEGAMTTALALGFTGIAVYLASNRAFAMLSLSNQFQAAGSESEQAMYLAAGEALLAVDNPGLVLSSAGGVIGLLLVVVAGFLFSWVMLRSPLFNRAAAYTGLLANGLMLFYFAALAIAPAITWLPASLSAPFRLVWYVLIAVRLFQLGRTRSSL